MSTQQGSYNTYIGARYVPIFSGQWDNTKSYEPLVIVEYQGNSYTSKTYVPVGADINNTDFWALTGNYNAQVEAYRQEVVELKNNGYVYLPAYRVNIIGDNATDNSTAFNALTINDNVGLKKGVYKILENTTIDANIQIANGAIIDVPSNITLTVNGFIEAGIYQIFQGTGNIILNGNSKSFVEWFGAIGNGVNDDIISIQKAINAYPNGNGNILFQPNKKYIVSDEIELNKSFMKLSCSIPHARQINPLIISSSLTKNVIHIYGNPSGDFGGDNEGTELNGLTISRKTMGVLNSNTILVENSLQVTLKECGFSMSQYGLHIQSQNGVKILNCHGTVGGEIAGQEIAGIFVDGSVKGNTGILIDQYLFYGYGSENSIQYAYKDKSSDTQAGDRRLFNIECAGTIDYGIYYETNGGFSMDTMLNFLTMDSVKKAGVFIKTNSPLDWQQFHIDNVWLRLDNVNSKGIYIEKYPNVNISNIHINPAYSSSDKNTYGLHLNISQNCVVNNFIVTGEPTLKLIQMDSPNRIRINNVVCPQDSSIYVNNGVSTVVENVTIGGNVVIENSDGFTYKHNCLEKNMQPVIGVDYIKLYPNVSNSGAGQTVQFNANLVGTEPFEKGVIWKVAGSRSTTTNISTTGLLSIGSDETEKTLFVICTSVSNSDVYQIAIVNIY